MKHTTIKKLQELFVGRVCTILTVRSAKQNFQDEQFPDFFTAQIDSLDEDGVFAKHYITGCSNFYSWPHIISIFEEQVIQEDNPQYENIMKEVQKTPAEQQVDIVPVNNSPFVNPDSMASLAQKAKEIQNTMLRKN